MVPEEIEELTAAILAAEEEDASSFAWKGVTYARYSGAWVRQDKLGVLN